MNKHTHSHHTQCTGILYNFQPWTLTISSNIIANHSNCHCLLSIYLPIMSTYMSCFLVVVCCCFHVVQLFTQKE